MIRSMTGYGSAQLSSEGWVCSVECRSVNHKTFDTRVVLPRSLYRLESEVLDRARAVVSRGRVEIRVDVQRATSVTVHRVNHEAFKSVVAELKELAEMTSLPQPTIQDVLSVRDVLSVTEEDGYEGTEGVVLDLVKKAMTDLVGTRQDEGNRLGKVMLELLDRIVSEFDTIEASRDEILAEYQSRLLVRTQETLEKFSVEIDAARIAHEAVIYADRSDVAEEVQRARSHCEKLRELILAPDDQPCGKQIDFYLQELMREANTTGSKSSHTFLTDSVVRIKATIEQLREQSSNIE